MADKSQRRLIKHYIKSTSILSLFLALTLILGGASVVSAATANTTITSVVSPVIAVTSSGSVSLPITPSGAGVQTEASDTVTVNTNDSVGYTLTLASTSATVTITSGANTIPASTGTQAVPVVQTANSWGYCVPTVATMTGLCPSSATSNQAISATYKFAGMPASGAANTIANPNTAQTYATNATTTVWYGVATKTTQASGSYTGTVVYTATAN